MALRRCAVVSRGCCVWEADPGSRSPDRCPRLRCGLRTSREQRRGGPRARGRGPAGPNRLTCARVRRGFRNLRAKTGTSAGAPKPTRRAPDDRPARRTGGPPPAVRSDASSPPARHTADPLATRQAATRVAAVDLPPKLPNTDLTMLNSGTVSARSRSGPTGAFQSGSSCWRHRRAGAPAPHHGRRNALRAPGRVDQH